VGVYHLMGLGRSVGAVTGPVSYLASRFRRWNPEDQEFFGMSGERLQRETGEKVGDVQAILLFTSPEVYAGIDKRFWCYEYVLNQPGHCPPPNADRQRKEPMRQALRSVLSQEWAPVAKGRNEVKLYWCEVNRTDLLDTFHRAALVLSAVKSTGSLGKEVWINLTGGNNVTNLALQLSASLLQHPSRFYYVQAQNPVAESCARYTRENGYWVDLPLLIVAPDQAHRTVLENVAAFGAPEINSLFQQLKANTGSWSLFQHIENLEAFDQQYVRPLLQGGLLEKEGGRVRTGPRWRVLRPYYQALDAMMNVNQESQDLKGLVNRQPWFHQEELRLQS